MTTKKRLGVSSCLLGEKVRYDGSHKHNDVVVRQLGLRYHLVPVCPEQQCGMGVPREPMHLEGDPDAPRLITNQTCEDRTEQLLTWCRSRLDELETDPVCGFVFKSRSPSCGMQVSIQSGAGDSSRTCMGLWVRCFTQRFPHLPSIEDVSVSDEAAYLRFIEQIQR